VKMTYQNRQLTPRVRPKGTKMGRGHFNLIAQLIRTFPVTPAVRLRLADYFADGLADTNPAFNRSYFLIAATPTTKE
jgi:hypothetical protein